MPQWAQQHKPPSEASVPGNLQLEDCLVFLKNRTRCPNPLQA